MLSTRPTRERDSTSSPPSPDGRESPSVPENSKIQIMLIFELAGPQAGRQDGVGRGRRVDSRVQRAMTAGSSAPAGARRRTAMGLISAAIVLTPGGVISWLVVGPSAGGLAGVVMRGLRPEESRVGIDSR